MSGNQAAGSIPLTVLPFLSLPMTETILEIASPFVCIIYNGQYIETTQMFIEKQVKRENGALNFYLYMFFC